METAIAALFGAVLGGFFAALSFVLLASRYKVARRLEQGTSLLESLRVTQARESDVLDETRVLLGEARSREGRFEDLMRRAELALASGREIWGAIEAKERTLNARAAELEARSAALEAREAAVIAQQEEVSSWTPELAKAAWLERLDQELSSDRKRILNLERKRLDEERRAMLRRVLLTAIERQDLSQGLERIVESIELPQESLKTRLIGRENRNARAFQRATGVDLIIDDSPGVVLLSSFDPMRRAVAAAALEHLFEGGAIHPARIDEAVAQARAEIDERSLALGSEAAQRCGQSDLAEELKIVLGRLHYHSSYGQNGLAHSLEVALVAGALAAEIGLDASLARRAGLLHDIGRALELDLESSHEVAGARYAERRGESTRVCEIIAAHHELEARDDVAQLVHLADRISAERPGARLDSINAQVERVSRMEGIARKQPGVIAAYAFNAGRELRVFVAADAVSDKAAAKLSRELAKELEGEWAGPGRVQVRVLRESLHLTETS